jgi:hypothetical protein
MPSAPYCFRRGCSLLPWLVLILSLTLSIACYLVSIRGEFAFDDHLAIANNDDTQPGSDISKVV